VYITGTIQQRGTGRQWFKPKLTAEAEYEFVVQQVELLKDVQDKHLEKLTLRLPVERVDGEMTEMLTEAVNAHPGKTKLQIQVYDETERSLITFTSQSHTVRVDKDFYQWLKQQEEEGTLSVSAQ